MNTLELLTQISKADNPQDQMMSLFLSDTRVEDELRPYFDIIIRIQRAGHRYGYHAGIKTVVEEITERYKAS